MKERLRVGIVTVEPHGWPWARVIARHMGEAVELTALWDNDPACARTFADQFSISKIVERPEDMIGQVDAVLVAGGRPAPAPDEPWGLRRDEHLRLARPFLQANVPVMIDKPLADTLEDGLEIVRLARAHHTVMMSCSANRYAAEIMSLQQLAADGDLGQLMGATCTIGTGVSTFGWYLVHIFEAIYSVFGPGVESVYAMSSGSGMTVGGGQLAAAHAALFRWRDGRLVTVLQLRDDTEGTTGDLRREPRILWPTTTPVPPYLPLFYYIQVYGNMAWQQALVKGKGAYRRNLEAFFAAVRSGEPPIPYAQTLEITQALAAAERSAETGQPVTLTPVENLTF